MPNTSIENPVQDSRPTSQPKPSGELIWLPVLGLSAILAIGWPWLMAGGFPFDHPRFWSGRVVPFIVVSNALIGMAGRFLRRPAMLVAAASAITAALVGGAVSAWVVFPISAPRFVLPLAALAILLLISLIRLVRAHGLNRLAALPFAITGAAIGVAFPLTQRAPLASTTPLNVPFPVLEPLEKGLDHLPFVRVSESASVLTNEGSIDIRLVGLRVLARPLLTFESRSPDRCWSNLAPPSQRTPVHRKLIQMKHESREFAAEYRDLARQFLAVHDKSNGINIDAYAALDAPVYSHLNTFLELTVSGHKKLFLSFSPCSGERIEVLPSDYPIGRPARFAYLDAAGHFRVVAATTGEKGPFHVLAEAALKPGEPLSIIFWDGEQPKCVARIEDWSAQASTDLSSTAGWGIPVNAIEFARQGEEESAPGMIWITLAGTSVGRGWDTVGHVAGTYRNRLHIEPVGGGVNAKSR